MPKDHRLVMFGLLLAAAGTGWVLTSASLITAFAPQPVRDPVDFLRVVVLNDQSWLFEAWLSAGRRAGGAGVSRPAWSPSR